MTDGVLAPSVARDAVRGADGWGVLRRWGARHGRTIGVPLPSRSVLLNRGSRCRALTRFAVHRADGERWAAGRPTRAVSLGSTPTDEHHPRGSPRPWRSPCRRPPRPTTTAARRSGSGAGSSPPCPTRSTSGSWSTKAASTPPWPSTRPPVRRSPGASAGPALWSSWPLSHPSNSPSSCATPGSGTPRRRWRGPSLTGDEGRFVPLSLRAGKEAQGHDALSRRLRATTRQQADDSQVRGCPTQTQRLGAG